MQIKVPDIESFGVVSEQLLLQNDLNDQEAIIYMQITSGVALRSHSFPIPEPQPTIYAYAAPVKPPVEKWEHGVSVKLVPDIRWARCDIKSIALLPNVLAARNAKSSGVEEALFVRDGVVLEGSHTNFAAIFDGELWTAPCSNTILSGITRQVVLELCHDLNIPVRLFPIQQADLSSADEAMIVGTTTEVMPTIKIDDQKVGAGVPGPLTRKLQNAFQKIKT